MPWESDSGLEVCVSHPNSLGPQEGMHTHSPPKGETGVSWQEASLLAKRACRTCPGYHPQGPPRDESASLLCSQMHPDILPVRVFVDSWGSLVSKKLVALDPYRSS